MKDSITFLYRLVARFIFIDVVNQSDIYTQLQLFLKSFKLKWISNNTYFAWSSNRFRLGLRLLKRLTQKSKRKVIDFYLIVLSVLIQVKIYFKNILLHPN